MDGLTEKIKLGADILESGGVRICLWAPYAQTAEIEWLGHGRYALRRDDEGYFHGHFPERKEGDLYYFHLDGKTRITDPASRDQPQGVFGPSAVLDTHFAWQDDGWKGISLHEAVIYEVHTGTFTAAGTFDGIASRIPALRNLGITAVEIMPVAQFPGSRNWGYDGVFPNAAQNNYGGPYGLKNLVNTLHQAGIAVILDVVYNHLGPEGNVFGHCGPYISETHKTPWAEGMNFDAEDSDHVRRFFLQNAWQWFTEFHIDGLRLDAVDTIIDMSPMPFMEELSHLKTKAENVTGRKLLLIAESAQNDPRVVMPADQCGLGMDAQWSDDFHHVLHVILTGEQDGYYADYEQDPAQLAHIYKKGVYYEGNYSPYRKRRHGRSHAEVPPCRLVGETQNHDQVGNRSYGRRLSHIVGFERLKLAAGCLLLSPFLPLIFMGEESASKAHFYYFIDYRDQELAARTAKFRTGKSLINDTGEKPPPPAAVKTFTDSILEEKDSPEGAVMRAYYTALIAFSKEIRGEKPDVSYDMEEELIRLDYKNYIVLLSFSKKAVFECPNGKTHDCLVNSTLFQPDKNPPAAYRESSRIDIAPYSVYVLDRKAP